MSLRRLDALLLVALTLLAFGLRVAGLGYPAPGPAGHVFDERLFADAACKDIAGQDYLDPEPPLAKLLIAAGIEVGGLWLQYPAQPAEPGLEPCAANPPGYGTWGWRLASLAFGTALIPLLYLLALTLWPVRLFAALAALLIALDGLAFVQSRLALLDIFPVSFAVLALLLLQLHRGSQSSARYWLSGMALGVAIGLGVASKWTALAAWGLALTVLFGGWLLNRLRIRSAAWALGGLPPPAGRPGPARAADRLLFYAGALVLLPALIYLVSYARYLTIPHAIPLVDVGSCGFGQLASFQPALDPGQWLREVFLHDRWAFAYHTCQTRLDANDSPWFTWPFLLHPVVYYQAEVVSGGHPLNSVVWNLGNPAIWWAAIPALVYCLMVAVRDRSLVPAVIVAGYLWAWLPFSQIGRGLYLYHMLGALPFMALGLAFALTRLTRLRLTVELGSRSLRIGGGRLLTAYLLLVVAAFVFFHPLWTGTPLTGDAYQARLWIDLPQLRASWR